MIKELVYFPNSRLKETADINLPVANDKIFTVEQAVQMSTSKFAMIFLHHGEASSCPKHTLFLLLPVFHVFCSPVLPKIRYRNMRKRLVL